VTTRLAVWPTARREPDCFIEQAQCWKLGNADMACKSLSLRLGERGDGLLEQNFRIRPVHHQDGRTLDAEIPQTLVDGARKVVLRRYSWETLVVRKISFRGTPDARMPSPTPRSVPYFQAVSMRR